MGAVLAIGLSRVAHGPYRRCCILLGVVALTIAERAPYPSRWHSPCGSA